MIEIEKPKIETVEINVAGVTIVSASSQENGFEGAGHRFNDCCI